MKRRSDYQLLVYKMKIRYDPDADALYIKFRNLEVNHTKEIDKNTVVDFDKDDLVIGVEILFVKESYPDLLREFQVENLIQV